MGYHQYHSISQTYKIPIVVTGFEPLDLLKGILMTIDQLESGMFEVQNAYTRVVSEPGNIQAQNMIRRVFEDCDRNWRGIGMIPQSGWKLRSEYGSFDAENRFQVGAIQTQESEICISGQILQGIKKPHQCPAFGKTCTPQNPLGATMVSSEGTCAAYYRYARVGEGIKHD
jgi:hydrogenase expression/formation protein HypD